MAYTDDFTGDENPLSTNWTVGKSAEPVRKSGGVAFGSAINKSCVAYYDAGSFSDDHYSQIISAGVVDANHSPGITLRSSGTESTLNCYIIAADTTTIYIEKFVNGVWNDITTRSTTFASGYGLKASIHNSGPSQVIRVWVDSGSGFVQQGTDISDSSFQSGGAPGISLWDYTGHTNDSAITSWEGGDVELGVNTNITPWTTLYEGP